MDQVTVSRELLRQVIGVIERSQAFVEASADRKLKSGWGGQLDEAEIAITALRNALEQPAVEPVKLGAEWAPCMKLPVVVHVRHQRPGERHISTREGITPVKPDDLIMRGVSGEEYPIGRAIFEQTYTIDVAAPKAQQPAPDTDIPDLIAGTLGVSRGTAYDLMRESFKGLEKEVLTLRQQPAPVQKSGWMHLKTYGYAPGSYQCRCHKCGETANGMDKRAITCRPCAESMFEAQQPRKAVKLTDEEIEALKRAHQEAMYRTGSTRIPECGWFGAIAQDLDFVLSGITGESK